ncbi:hypothetical protein AA310_16205 [Arthrobacter sp. YC-RL1]|uniref:hypothetical protein n=1 Tax=Micrococcaceae TaxID=1268 RepID=UPI00063DAB89|nr:MULTISPECIES: hypothetical protein [Micrococcaceae]ALQ29405.1 hypothetical protein ATC04_01850 [Arthrobacter sp. YC-RL1]KLI89206.1 hypothetical protein AA310_16205 [Arthrobacter sp. YC-RL1]WPR64487.1 hypothetical protein SLW72_16600 [Glutamicibacter protophormiae]WPR67981.1 hypothetical protein SLW73_16590 [Glutamicibacter protophormiae]
MSSTRKPGYDTLVFFWFAIVLWVLGIASMSAQPYFLLIGAITVNSWGLTVLSMAGIGFFLLAGVFSIVVVHKIIAMLVYLVHGKP